jgi:hypothetical protein
VFTARYALSPYIKQISFVFKGLNNGVYHKPAADLRTYRLTSPTQTVLNVFQIRNLHNEQDRQYTYVLFRRVRVTIVEVEKQ